MASRSFLLAFSAPRAQPTEVIGELLSGSGTREGLLLSVSEALFRNLLRVEEPLTAARLSYFLSVPDPQWLSLR